MKYRNTPLQIKKKSSADHILDPNTNTKFSKDTSLTDEGNAQFELDIVGKIVWPWSPGYDTDKQDFNNVYPTDPIMIVYAANYNDVRECLKYANDNNIWTVIRSGAHSLAGYSVNDGMIIDMSQINNVYIYTSNKTAFVEAGCNFGKLFPMLEMYNLHMPGGGCPTVAVAGYMQGGGYGLTSRAFGIHCDNVISVTVMLADGNIVVANNTQNQDLFWAIRGGTGGNFGVLLNITYQLYDLGNIYGIRIQWDIEDYDNAALALETIQNNYLYPSRYSNLGIETVLCNDTDNVRKVMFCASWIGDEASFNNALAPLMAVPNRDVALRTYGKYSKVNSEVLDGTPVLPPGQVMAFSRSAYISRQLTVADWKTILKFYMTSPNKYAMVDMECYGGKINETPENENAFIHRNVTMNFFCDVYFTKETNDQKQNEEWLQSFFEFMTQYGNGHSYQNYPNRLQEDFRNAYWGKYYDLLVYIKNKYDPTNFFHYQQSIGQEQESTQDSEYLSMFESKPIEYEKY